MDSDAAQYLRHLQNQSLESLTFWGTGIGAIKRGGHHGIENETIETSHHRIRKAFESIVSKIDKTYQEKLLKVPVGVLYLPNFNAYTILSPNGYKLIALNVKLDSILVQFNSVILLWMKGGLPLPVEEYVRNHTLDIISPLRDIMHLPYDVKDKEKISLMFKSPTEDFLMMKKMVSCQLTFVLAHEMGHIIHDHFEGKRQIIGITEDPGNENDEAEAIIRSHNEEYQADKTGFEICRKHFPESSFLFNFVSIFFLINYLYERINSVNLLIQSNLTGKPMHLNREMTIPSSTGSHPSTIERIKNIYFGCFKEQYERSEQKEIIARFFNHTVSLFDRYFAHQLSYWQKEGKIIPLESELEYRTEIQIF